MSPELFRHEITDPSADQPAPTLRIVTDLLETEAPAPPFAEDTTTGAIKRFPWEEASAISHTPAVHLQPPTMPSVAADIPASPETIYDTEVNLAGGRILLFHKRRAGYLALRGHTQPNDISPPALPAVDKKVHAAVTASLPHLKPLQRQALVLATCYKLPLEAIGAVLGRDPALVEKVLRNVMPLSLGQFYGKIADEEAKRKRDCAKPAVETIRSTHKTILLYHPEAEVTWQLCASGIAEPELKTHSRFDSLRFGKAEVTIDEPPYAATISRQKSLILATLGLSNQQISRALGLSVQTVKTHLRKGFSDHGYTTRTDIAIDFLRSGYYKIATYGEEIRMSKREEDVAKRVALGQSYSSISKDLCISVETVKTHAKRVMQRNEFSCREHLSMALLLSGQVSVQQSGTET